MKVRLWWIPVAVSWSGMWWRAELRRAWDRTGLGYAGRNAVKRASRVRWFGPAPLAA